MYNYAFCPCCSGQSFTHFIDCKDYTVSQESFSIVSCNSCNLKITKPIPEISELGKYYKSEDYISHSDTRKGVVAKLYHLVKSHTLKQKLALIRSYVSRGTILDYGCGTGAFLKTCQESGWSGFGIEPDEGARMVAEKAGLKVFANRAGLPSEPLLVFDVITLWHVLEHVPDLAETLSFLHQSLSPKGIIIIAVPNHKSFDAEYYHQYWAAYDVPRHLYHFDSATISRLMHKHSFKLAKTYPMPFDSFYVSMLSEKYKTGSINYLRAASNGLKSNFKARQTGNFSSLIYVFKKD